MTAARHDVLGCTPTTLEWRRVVALGSIGTVTKVRMEESVSLAEAIKDAMQARGLHTAEVSRRLGEGYDRATFYRLLSGATSEPRLGTLVGLCRVLEISPTELLELAGLWPYRERTSDALDVRLRDSFAQLQALPPDDKRRAVAVVSCIADSWQEGPEQQEDLVESEDEVGAPV